MHPQLRALRNDDRPQRIAQNTLHEALADWRTSPNGALLDNELVCYSKGAHFADLPLLCGCFANADDTASRLIGELVARLTGALVEAPLGHVPFRHFTDGMTSTLLIARKGGASLSLIAVDGALLAGRPRPQTASFTAMEAVEHILSGTADAELIGPAHAEGSPLPRQHLYLSPGALIHRNCAQQSLSLRRVNGVLVSLRLQRRADCAEPTREYSRETGALVAQAASNQRHSQLELAAALLGRMGRTDAAPLLAAMAQESGGESLRWQALRECLGLDTATGFSALSAVAAESADPLCAPAGALRAQLIELHPQLQEIMPCRA